MNAASAKYNKYCDQLFEAEAAAQAAKKQLWANWVEPVAEAAPATTDDGKYNVSHGHSQLQSHCSVADC